MINNTILNRKMFVDVLLGLQYGDEGKGKISSALCFSKNAYNEDEYEWCIRFNGGPNAGHKVYMNEQKYVLHQVPSGILNENMKCLIGCGCVVDLDKLNREIEELTAGGIKNIRDRLWISPQCHIIQPSHIEKDRETNKVGTTNSGIGPTYADKALRTGKRVEQCTQEECSIRQMDSVQVFETAQNNILMEGAQGFYLDIDWGTYPYTTSSHCGIAGALTAGFPPQCIRRIYGIAKAYETYLGTMDFQPKNDPLLVKYAEQGNEVGNTTGRVRQCNYLDIRKLCRSIYMNGITHLIINKCDIPEAVGEFRIIDNGKQHSFSNRMDFEKAVCEYVKSIRHLENTRFSYSPYCI